MSDEKAREALARIKAPIDTVLLDDISRALRNVAKHLEETTPEGVDIPIADQYVDGTKPVIIDVSHQPLRNVYLRNKGPNTVYYLVNDDPTEIALDPQESIPIQRPRRTIVKITLRSRTGESATVRMNGQY